MKRGILIYNPTAGQRDLRAQMVALIERTRRRGLELVNAPTSAPGDATRIVRSFLARGIDVVVVCGGDGTISEAAAGLIGSEVPLAVLPGGTSNVLARELAIPLGLPEAEELLFDGVPTEVRVGYAGDRPFLLWTGVGLDARVMRNINLRLKRWLGRHGIFFAAASQFARYEFPRLRVRIDGVEHGATFAVVCRARHYAGDWIIAPDARTHGDNLDVMLFGHRSHWKLFRLFREMRSGRAGHLADGLARVVRGREVEISSDEDYAVEVEIDGDFILETPVKCRVGDERVKILVPREREPASTAT